MNFLAQDAVHKKWPNGNASDIDRQRFCHNPINGVYKQMNDAFESGDDVIHKWIPRSPKT